MHSSSKERKDEYLTPKYAVIPIIKYLDNKFKGLVKNKNEIKIWCPFDKEDSAFVQVLRQEGYTVIPTHIDNGEDFFKYVPNNYDIIISNPPFSVKDNVLKRLRQLDRPFCLMFPIGTLQGQKRFNNLVGCQALIFDKRIKFFLEDNNGEKRLMKSPDFATIYLAYDFLPQDLIFEKIEEYYD